MGNLKFHSRYTKYHYKDLIIIHVLKCRSCEKYHSLIPSFSLPGTSLGTKEVEQYTLNRNAGLCRREAGVTLLEKGISFKHLAYIEKLMKVCLLRLKALIPQGLHTNKLLPGFIFHFNHLCLQNRINAVFCNRVNILIFFKRKPGRICSNDMGTTGPPRSVLDSS